jgi:hypothetical protein
LKMSNFCPIFSSCRHIEIEVHQAVYPSGFGYWKINPMILKQLNLREKYYDLCRELRQYNVFNAISITWWNKTIKAYCNCKTKLFFKNEAKTVNTAIRRQKNIYYNILLDIAQRQNKEENVDADMTFVRTKLLEIEDKRLECFGLKLKESVLSAEKKVNIFQLVRDRSSAMKINPMDLDGARLEISGEKLKKTLYLYTRKTSPGPDGLAYKFYMICYEELKDDQLKLYNK